jgi:hypothetical protein
MDGIAHSVRSFNTMHYALCSLLINLSGFGDQP